MTIVNVASFELIQGVPIVHAKHNQTELNFIIDTGASSCAICNTAINKIKYKDSECQYLVYGIDGSHIEAKEIITDIQIGDYVFQDLKFQKVDIPGIDRLNKKYGSRIILHGLLGSNFLSHFHLIINYDEWSLQIKETDD